MANYIAADNSAAAEALVGRLRATFALLAENPLVGSPRTEWAPELRAFVVGRYVILYRPRGDGVEIVRVIHGARYLPGLL